MFNRNEFVFSHSLLDRSLQIFVAQIALIVKLIFESSPPPSQQQQYAHVRSRLSLVDATKATSTDRRSRRRRRTRRTSDNIVFDILILYWNAATDTVWWWIMPASHLYGTLTRKLYEIWQQSSEGAEIDQHGGASLTDSLPAIATDTTAAATTTTTPTTTKAAKLERNRRHLIADIQQLFHQIDIYPTESQVYEMIQCASRCTLSSRRPDLQHHSADKNGDASLTFGPFCYFASILINNYRQNIPPPKPLSQSDALIRKLERAQQSISDDSAQNDTNFEVFLGGSCNPTRWRQEVVIPELKRHGITYYNPQVEHWDPELIELESYAKKNSEVLFFVVDNQTRAIASMIEVAFLASTERKLILVINDLPGPKCKIVNDELSTEEYENLRKGRAYLRDVVERQGIPIFSQISIALKSAIRVLRDDIWPQQLKPPHDDIVPVRMGHVSVGDKIIRAHKVFDSVKSGDKPFTFADLPIAYRMLTNRELSRESIEQLARCHVELDRSRANQQQQQQQQPQQQRQLSTTSCSSSTLSRSSSSTSDDPDDADHHFEMISSNTGSPITSSSSPVAKKPKSRSRKMRKLKKLQDIFASNESTINESNKNNNVSIDTLPPLAEITIDFDQFCCIMSELEERTRNQFAETEAAAANATSPTAAASFSTYSTGRSLLEKVGNGFWNGLKTIFTISTPGYESTPPQPQHLIRHQSFSSVDAALHPTTYLASQQHSHPQHHPHHLHHHQMSPYNSNSSNISNNLSRQSLPVVDRSSSHIDTTTTTTSHRNSPSPLLSSLSIDSISLAKNHRQPSLPPPPPQHRIGTTYTTHNQNLNPNPNLFYSQHLQPSLSSPSPSPSSPSSSSSPQIRGNAVVHARSVSPAASMIARQHRHSYSSPLPSPLYFGVPQPQQQQPSLSYHPSGSDGNSHHYGGGNHYANHHYNNASHYHHHASTHSLHESSRRGHHSSTSSISSLIYGTANDLYIGGSLDERLLQQEIIPLLKKCSITISTLKADRWTSQRMIPLEARNIEKNRVLLFLITKNSIEISFMIMAAHYIGLGYNVVLCIQYFDSASPFVVNDGKSETWLSTDAIKDYNRGRSYLSDLATKVGVPVFSDINESIQCCINLLTDWK